MEKLIALIIIVAIMATAIVPYVIGVIKSFQAYIPIGIIAVIFPPVGTIMFCPLYSTMPLLVEALTSTTDKHIGWCEILGYPIATKAAQIFNKEK